MSSNKKVMLVISNKKAMLIMMFIYSAKHKNGRYRKHIYNMCIFTHIDLYMNTWKWDALSLELLAKNINKHKKKLAMA